MNGFFLKSKKKNFLRLIEICIFVGEGWHNYHHVFPWDYKTSELGFYSLNLSTAFIDFFAKIGWAHELKTASKEIIERRSKRTGDGSRPNQDNATIDAPDNARINQMHNTTESSNLIYGWNDVDLHVDDKKYVTILNRM